jgi:hypothetical protein
MNLANVERIDRLFDVRSYGNTRSFFPYHLLYGGGPGYEIDGQKLQTFVAQIGTTGTNHWGRMHGDAWFGYPASYADKVIGAKMDGTTTIIPTVGPTVDFVAGMGITGNSIVFNTADQNPAAFWGMVSMEYYDGNVARPRPQARFVSRDVNGTVRYRLEVSFTDEITGAAWNVNPTNIPTARFMEFRFMGALA